jgi:hypothetical protein
MNPLQVETVRCALACRERRFTLVRYLPTSCQSFCLLHCTWQVFNGRIGPQQIIESPTDVNQIFVDNKVKDCLVCTTTSLIPAQEKRSLAFLFTIGPVAFSHALSSGKQLDSVEQTINFKEQPPWVPMMDFPFCAALVTAFAARSPAIGSALVSGDLTNIWNEL